MTNSLHIAGFVVVASLVGCAVDAPPETAPETPTVASDRATVTGRIVDTRGIAVAGATVSVRSSGEHATADSKGAFTLDVPANTTLTLAATAPSMAPTLLQQLMVSPGTSAAVEIAMVTGDHFKSLVAMGANPSGGVVAVAVKSLSGFRSVAGATVELTPALGRMMYPATDGMADPDPSMAATVQGDDSYAWALGVQPHVSIMQPALRGMTQVEPPYAINDITWPGTFTVDAGALTLVTLFTK
ncbi:MAG: carboxypeptidase regulatory-like domain-containing protein [Deltaproteobacteria bacterium]|nr:MAG: carboxypeptidase regulatory-like domain-containing protein [Deltaproteobacteria bacterium]